MPQKLGRSAATSPLFTPALLRRPDRLTDHPYWQAHIPFAFWLVDALQPRILVELGVYKGDSYCAFCQAVQEARIPAKCYGVDNWHGDVHYGEYGNEVLWELSQYHDPRYGGFSTLVRSDFEEALPLFSDGSIDLLHIDGTHTYDAVRRDFEHWLPKMSERGVVLFHDINERRAQYEVWRFWEEVRRQYPSFEFTHSSGLGVLKVGRNPVEAVDRLCGGEEAEISTFRALAASLGEGVQLATLRRNAQRERDSLYGQLQQLKSQAEAKGEPPAQEPPAPALLRDIEAMSSEMEGRLASLVSALEDRLRAVEGGLDGRFRLLEESRNEGAASEASTSRRIAGVEGELTRLAAAIERDAGDAAGLRNRLSEVEAAIARLSAGEARVAGIERELGRVALAITVLERNGAGIESASSSNATDHEELRVRQAEAISAIGRLSESLADLALTTGRAGVAVHERLAELYDRAEKANEVLRAVSAKVDAQEAAVWARLGAMDGWLRSLSDAKARLEGRVQGVEAQFQHGLAGRIDEMALRLGQLELAQPWPSFVRRLFTALRGARARREVAASGLFDAAYYVRTYPEAAAAGMDPLDHFLRVGTIRGFDPGPRFDTQRYWAAHPDVRASGQNALVHFLRHGARGDGGAQPKQSRED